MNNAVAQPTALDVVRKTLQNLKKIGTPAQQREAEEIERRLEDQAQAVNFARRARGGENPEGKK